MKRVGYVLYGFGIAWVAASVGLESPQQWGYSIVGGLWILSGALLLGHREGSR